MSLGRAVNLLIEPGHERSGSRSSTDLPEAVGAAGWRWWVVLICINAQGRTSTDTIGVTDDDLALQACRILISGLLYAGV